MRVKRTFFFGMCVRVSVWRSGSVWWVVGWGSYYKHKKIIRSGLHTGGPESRNAKVLNCFQCCLSLARIFFFLPFSIILILQCDSQPWRVIVNFRKRQHQTDFHFRPFIQETTLSLHITFGFHFPLNGPIISMYCIMFFWRNMEALSL